MSDKTGISWCDATWNPTVGCSRVSSGCKNCYAFALHDKRHQAWKDGWEKAPPQYHKPFRELQLMSETRLMQPMKWKKPRRIFVNSVSDTFHEDVPELWIMKIWGVMALAAHQRFMVFTKRPKRMREFLKATWPIPLANVMVGVSVENQATADERIPLLLDTPAAVHAVSYEPALGPVEFTPWLSCPACGYTRDEQDKHGDHYLCKSAIRGEPNGGLALLDWIIVGGESGSGAREFHCGWAQAVVEDCKAAGVKVHVKQMGSNPYRGNEPWNLPGKGGDMLAWPPALRVREWPGEG